MRRSIIAAVTVLALSVVPHVSDADGPAPTREDTYPVAPGIVREVRSWSTPAGGQRVQILRFRVDDERVDLRPELAMGAVPGREPVHHTLLRLGDDAVAGVNAGFWLDTPSGDPEGLVIRDGVYVSEPATRGPGPRAAFALFDDATWAVGRPDHHGEVWLPSGAGVELFGINRAGPVDSLTALNAAYGPTTDAPEDAVEAVFDLRLRPNMLGSYPVEEVRAPGGPLTSGSTVLVGRGRWAAELEELQPGDLVTFDLRASHPWDDAVHALAAGPLLLEDGERVPADEWQTEGFVHGIHNDRAHPRTVIGFTQDGEVLLVTVDGRQDDSPGVTTGEAADLMEQLGAVDAVMLDGGGSTTMAVDGRIRNQPCCDSPGYRWVASSLVLRSSAETPGVDRLAGPDRYATAARVAAHGWPDGAPHVFVTNGTSFPDGLAGGPLAAAQGAPLLLTAGDELPRATSDALRDLGVERATILGGPAAVAPHVAEAIAATGVMVDRIAGPDRWATAVEIGRRAPQRSTTALLANGRGFADALAAVVPAYSLSAPLLLTERDFVPGPTLVGLEEFGVERVVIVGGPTVVSDQVQAELSATGLTVERVAGPTRYETAVALVEWAQAEGLAPSSVAIASGTDFPDALAGGAFAAAVGAPVLLSGPDSLERTGPPAAWLAQNPISEALVFGGRVKLSTWTLHELQAAIDAS